MKKETKRFVAVLCCTAVIALLVAEIIPFILNTVDRVRLARIQTGMPRDEVVRILHKQPISVTNDVEEINIMEHRSWLRDLFTISASGSGKTVIIETGRVTHVAWSFWTE